MSTPTSAPETSHAPIQDHFHSEPSHGAGLSAYLKQMPYWVLAAFALVVIVGAILIGGRKQFAESAAFNAMKNCDARLVEKVYGAKYAQVLGDGLHEGFGSVHIGKDRDGIANVLSICDLDPQTGLALFRKALASGNKSAKLVALYCANFLARAQPRPQADTMKGVLEADDFASMLKLLDPKVEPDVEIRRAAQRAVSDLVVLADPSAKDRYEKIPPELSKEESIGTADDATGGKGIKTKEDKLNGKPILLVRWSGNGIARAWWKENVKAGAGWDKEKQRFVIP